MAGWVIFFSEIESGYAFILDMKGFLLLHLITKLLNSFATQTTNADNLDDITPQHVPIENKMLKTTQVKRLSKDKHVYVLLNVVSQKTV